MYVKNDRKIFSGVTERSQTAVNTVNMLKPVMVLPPAEVW